MCVRKSVPDDTIRKDLLNSGILDAPGITGEPEPVVGDAPLLEEVVSRRSFAMGI